MEGAITGEALGRERLIRIAKATGDKELEEAERTRDDGQIIIPAKARQAIWKSGLKDGSRYVAYVEDRVRTIIGRSLDRDKRGLEVDHTQVATDLANILLIELETKAGGADVTLGLRDSACHERDTTCHGRDNSCPIRDKTCPNCDKTCHISTLAKRRVSVKSPQGTSLPKVIKAHRKKQTASMWEDAMAKAARKSKPRTLAQRRATTAMQTGWNRWQNKRTKARALENPEVIYMVFTLGIANQHTDICLAREGFVFRKRDPRLAANTPPLHFGCRSRLIEATRAASKKWGIKPWTPPGWNDDDVMPDEGFAMKSLTRAGDHSRRKSNGGLNHVKGYRMATDRRVREAQPQAGRLLHPRVSDTPRNRL